MTGLTASRREAARWGTAFALAALAHGALAVAVLANWQVPEPAGTPVAIELDMLAAAPDAASAESVPGPEQTQTEQAPEPEKTEAPPETPVEQAAIEPPAPVETPVVAPEPLPRPDVVPAKPAPKREVKKPERTKPEPRKPEPKPRAVAATTAPSAADTVASIPSPGRFGQGSADARPSWNSRIVAHLQRHKRYPAEAQARGETGVARLSFTIDRSGHVLSSRVSSSGFATLDRETAALIQRAEPLPPAPPALAGARFSFSVPIRYSMR
jgi:protein TonB